MQLASETHSTQRIVGVLQWFIKESAFCGHCASDVQENTQLPAPEAAEELQGRTQKPVAVSHANPTSLQSASLRHW